MPGVTTAYQTGVHGSRPAASAGCILYSCTTHNLVYRSDGTSWTTWLTSSSGSSSASPALTLSTSASAGAASTFVATDATIPIFDATSPSTQAFSDTAVVGTAAFAARRDHKHAMPASPGGGSPTGARYPVQSAATGSASSTTRVPVLGSAPTNGNRLVLVTLAEPGDAVSSVVTTNVSWTKIAGSAAGVAPVMEIWVGVVSASASATTTVTFGASGFHSAVLAEWTGLTGTLDASATSHTTVDDVNIHPIPLFTPVTATALVVVALGTSNNGIGYTAFEGPDLFRICPVVTSVGAYFGFPGTVPVYGLVIGGNSTTATGLSVSIV